MNAQQQINAWFQKFEHRFHTAVPNIVAETATEFFQDKFKTEEWEGVPWEALNPKYASKKTRGAGRILTASGILQRSIRPTIVTAGKVVISAGNSKVPYARIHNEGLRMRRVEYVRGYHNKNFMGTGKRVQIKPHSRKIDFKAKKRQFMGHSTYLNKQLKQRLLLAFKK